MPTTFTIGYEGTDLPICCHAEKRRRSGSRRCSSCPDLSEKKGFSKNGLRLRLEDTGIRYLHFVELGDPKEGRDAARRGRHADFRRIYTRHLNQHEPAAAFAKLALVAQQETTCLMCFEHNPITCHRSIVAERLVHIGIDVLHLYCDDPARFGHDAARRPRHHHRESAAAA